jgi:hypothetical protein
MLHFTIIITIFIILSSIVITIRNVKQFLIFFIVFVHKFILVLKIEIKSLFLLSTFGFLLSCVIDGSSRAGPCSTRT